MCVQLSRLFIFVWVWTLWKCCRTWDTFPRSTISRVFPLIQGSSDFPTAPLLWLCGNMLSRVWTERLSTGFITLSSLNKPQRCVTPPHHHHHHPSQLLSFFHFRVSIRLDCPSVNIAWVAISDGVTLATPQVPSLLLWPCLIHWYMKLIYIYLTCSEECTHTHTRRKMGRWAFSTHPFNLWASCDGTRQFPLKYLCTLWPLMTFLMASAPVCITHRDCRRSHQGPVTQLRLQTRGITEWVLVM